MNTFSWFMGGVPVAGDGLQPEERHGGHSGTRR